MKRDLREPATPAWDGVLLVCKACGKRSNGPRKGLKAKGIIAEARKLLRRARPRPRVLLTSCLGLCPKAAVAMARVGATGGPRIAPVSSLAEVERLLSAMGG